MEWESCKHISARTGVSNVPARLHHPLWKQMKMTFSIINRAKNLHTQRVPSRWHDQSIEEIRYNNSKVSDGKNFDKIKEMQSCGHTVPHLNLYWSFSSFSESLATWPTILRHLLLGRKVMTNLDSILKSRDITLPTNVHLVKAMVFPVGANWEA